MLGYGVSAAHPRQIYKQSAAISSVMQSSSLTAPLAQPAGGRRFQVYGVKLTKSLRFSSKSHRRLFDSAAASTTKLSATTTTKESTSAPTTPPQNNRPSVPSTNSTDSSGFPAWSYTVDEVAAYHDVDLSQGLSPDDVEQRRISSGWNELDKPRRPPLWQQVWEQLDDPLVRVLLLAAVVSLGLVLAEQGGVNGASEVVTSSGSEGVVGGAVNSAASAVVAGEGGGEAASDALAGIQAYTEPIVIAAIVALNACIGVWQQQKAERSLEVRVHCDSTPKHNATYQRIQLHN